MLAQAGGGRVATCGRGGGVDSRREGVEGGAQRGKLEGATARQKNPHPKGSVARLGGWNCYYKPPGPKTMARGLDRAGRLEGFMIA